MAILHRPYLSIDDDEEFRHFNGVAINQDESSAQEAAILESIFLNDGDLGNYGVAGQGSLNSFQMRLHIHSAVSPPRAASCSFTDNHI